MFHILKTCYDEGKIDSISDYLYSFVVSRCESVAAHRTIWRNFEKKKRVSPSYQPFLPPTVQRCTYVTMFNHWTLDSVELYGFQDTSGYNFQQQHSRPTVSSDKQITNICNMYLACAKIRLNVNFKKKPEWNSNNWNKINLF